MQRNNVAEYLDKEFDEKTYEDAINGETFINTFLHAHYVNGQQDDDDDDDDDDDEDKQIGTIFFVVEAHGEKTVHTEADLKEREQINKMKNKYSEEYMTACENMYKKQTMLYNVIAYNNSIVDDKYKMLTEKEGYENFTDYVESSVSYTASIPFGFNGLLEVGDTMNPDGTIRAGIGCDHTSAVHVFKNLQCPAQRTRMVIDYANEFKRVGNDKDKTKTEVGHFYQLLRMRLKHLTVRHFNRAIHTFEEGIEHMEENKYFRYLIDNNKIMNEYKQSITYLNKNYSYGRAYHDRYCMKGIYIPLIVNNFGKCFTNENQTINIIEQAERDRFFTDTLLKQIIQAEGPKKRIRCLRHLFYQIDLNPKSSLWHLYLIGYILNLKVAIVDFSCYAYEDKTKRKTRSGKKNEEANFALVQDEGFRDRNLFSPADERNIIRGGGRRKKNKKIKKRMMTGKRMTGKRMTGKRMTGKRMTGKRMTGKRMTPKS